MWTQENDSMTEPVHALKVIPTPRNYDLTYSFFKSYISLISLNEFSSN
jgi:hypothetical protein